MWLLACVLALHMILLVFEIIMFRVFQGVFPLIPIDFWWVFKFPMFPFPPFSAYLIFTHPFFVKQFFFDFGCFRVVLWDEDSFLL